MQMQVERNLKVPDKAPHKNYNFMIHPSNLNTLQTQMAKKNASKNGNTAARNYGLDSLYGNVLTNTQKMMNQTMNEPFRDAKRLASSDILEPIKISPTKHLSKAYKMGIAQNQKN